MHSDLQERGLDREPIPRTKITATAAEASGRTPAPGSAIASPRGQGKHWADVAAFDDYDEKPSQVCSIPQRFYDTLAQSTGLISVATDCW